MSDSPVPGGRSAATLSENHSAWIQNLPDGWDIAPLRAFVTDAKNGIWGDPPAGDSNDVICARVADFDRTRAVLDLSHPTMRSVPTQRRQHRLLRRGDLLLEKSGSGEKQSVGQVVLVEDLPGPTICSNFVARMPVISAAQPSFVRYLHQHSYSIGLNQRSIKQTTGIQNLDAASYLREKALRPPLSTQRTIATFLDRETARIDSLIEKKRRLLNLLDEKRTALITHSVTRGLDPEVPMKDSGVEWLGEVPEHWAVKPLRRTGRVVDCKHRTPEYVTDGYPLVSTTEVKPGTLDLSVCTRFVNRREYQDMTEGARLPQLGDIVYSRNASLGSAALVASEAAFCMGQDVVLIRVDSDALSSEFLTLQLNSRVIRRQVESLGVGSTFSRINVATIRDLSIVLPPREEQDEIVSRIQKFDRQSTTLARKTRHAISLL